MENSVQTAAMLLEKTSVINKQFEARYMKTGEMYNIFKAAGIGKKEVYMCNVLADLLDPKGLHYRGNAYLKLFMDMVVIPRIEKEVKLNLSKAKVTREYVITDYKRIDIVISDDKVFIPIEAKIGTVDSPEQLAYYYDYSKSKNESGYSVKVLYLTPRGDDATNAEKDVYVPISFERDILPWLEACLALEERAPIRETIKQYIKAIRLFCGYLEDEEMAKEIKDLIMDSWDNYESALLIKKAVDEINGKVYELFKTQILNLVLKEFPDMEYYQEYGSYWHIITLGNDLTFSVSHDMKQFCVQKAETKLSLSGERKAKINDKMTGITNDRDIEKEEAGIWVCTNGRYRGLEKYDGDRYYYELYQIYSKNPQSVADWIVSIAKELEKI